jgi:hypothetical protein
LTLGVPTHKSPSVGEIGEHLSASSRHTKKNPGLKKMSAHTCLSKKEEKYEKKETKKGRKRIKKRERKT